MGLECNRTHVVLIVIASEKHPWIGDRFNASRGGLTRGITERGIFDRIAVSVAYPTGRSMPMIFSVY
jgi:hypothetical protein